MSSSRKYLADGTPNPAYEANRHPPGYKRPPKEGRTAGGHVKDTPRAPKEGRTADGHVKGTPRATPPTRLVSGYFIAWDGEGITPGVSREIPYAAPNKTTGKTEEVPVAEHTYNYLASSHGDALFRIKGTLRTTDCFELLLNSATKNPGAIHVIFAGSYDVNMMLYDVPRFLLEKIHKGETVDWGDYRISYIARKQFTVRRWNTPRSVKKGKTWVPSYSASIILWDVFGFFQTSFVKALKAYKFPPEDIAYIEGMKHKRGTFTATEFKRDVVPYCTKELEHLVSLMNLLRGYLIEAGLAVTRWDGGGAAATALFKREGIKQHTGTIPPEVMRASQYAYGGGRVDVLQIGYHNGPIYHYDIQSAYPDAMRFCLSFADGAWIHERGSWTEKEIRDRIASHPFSLWRIRYRFPRTMRLYPFFCRNRHNTITYEESGYTWVWSPEVLAALDSIPQCMDFLTVTETHFFDPEGEPVYPFAFIPTLYALRAQWKKEGNGAEKAVKLALNSMYGKTVQQVGARKDEKTGKWTPPTYFQLQWGGFITSFTRAKMYRAALQKPDGIIALATDGIYSTVPLDVEGGNDLGRWDYEQHTTMTSVMSGIYWYGNEDGSRVTHYRGFDTASLTEERVHDAWNKGEEVLTVPSTRFITMGSALIGKRFPLWRSWYTTERTLSLSLLGNEKRMLDLRPVRGRKGKPPYNPATGLVQTIPLSLWGLDSLPFPIVWLPVEGAEQVEAKDNEDTRYDLAVSQEETDSYC